MRVILTHPDDRRRYADAGFGCVAIEQAMDEGRLRKFRAKYRGRCAVCWKNIAVGQPVVSPDRGKIACAPCLYVATSKTWREV